MPTHHRRDLKSLTDSATVFEAMLSGIRTWVFAHTSSKIDVELGARLFRQRADFTYRRGNRHLLPQEEGHPFAA